MTGTLAGCGLLYERHSLAHGAADVLAFQGRVEEAVEGRHDERRGRAIRVGADLLAGGQQGLDQMDRDDEFLLAMVEEPVDCGLE